MRWCAALDETEILGLTTNTGFLRALVASDEFRTAAIDTAWLDHHEVPAPDPAPARQLAAWEVFLRDREESGPFASDGFRLSTDPAPVVIELDEPVVLGPRPAHRPAATVRQGRVEVTYQGQRFVFERADVFADHGPAAGDGTIAVAHARHGAGRARRGRRRRRRGRRTRCGRGDEDGAGPEGAVRRHGRGGRRAVGEQVSLGHQLFRIEKES